MEYPATLRKMTTYLNDEVHYLLNADLDFIHLNKLLPRKLTLNFTGEKYCNGCGNQFKDLFRMGFCKNCFFTRPEAGESIIRPELSKAHEGVEDRDLEFEKGYQLQPHVVYLALSGDLKVGVTRAEQKFTRWADQGASKAIVFAETENRYQAGMMEVALKKHLGDKTPWQRMLKNEEPEYDLRGEKERCAELLEKDWRRYVSNNDEIHELQYPVPQYPTKVKSINLDKNGEVEAKLVGIRGQYLIFEGGNVLNVRGHSGFRVSISI